MKCEITLIRGSCLCNNLCLDCIDEQILTFLSKDYLCVTGLVLAPCLIYIMCPQRLQGKQTDLINFSNDSSQRYFLVCLFVFLAHFNNTSITSLSETS